MAAANCTPVDEEAELEAAGFGSAEWAAALDTLDLDTFPERPGPSTQVIAVKLVLASVGRAQQQVREWVIVDSSVKSGLSGPNREHRCPVTQRSSHHTQARLIHGAQHWCSLDENLSDGRPGASLPASPVTPRAGPGGCTIAGAADAGAGH